VLLLRDEKAMRAVAPAILLATILLSPAGAEDPPPDLKGVWSGTARSVVLGSGYHHPGTETDKDPPRIREVRFTYTVRGQDGRLVWGTFASPSYEKPFAWAISRDNRTVLGADTDGQHRLMILATDQMELCYTHSALSPTKSTVASCFLIERTGR
jgi:hypothetical protein